MKQALITSLLGLLCLSSSAQTAREILLCAAPEAGAPVIAKVIATEKVLLDAAPAAQNAEAGWRQMELPTPFEGYVPVVAMDKNFTITKNTPVRYLPTTQAARITTVEAGDAYEVVRSTDEWATVRFRKAITGYFNDDATEEITLHLPTPQKPLPERLPEVQSAPAADSSKPVLEPVAIPAPPARVNPDAPIAQVDPASLPPENVVWKPGGPASSKTHRSSQSEGVRTPNPEPRTPNPATRISNPNLVVTPDQTQAREAAPDLGPDKTPRLLTGILKQNLAADAGAYPVRLRSPEDRLIAFVDLSGVYISELEPYLDQKVYLRGQIHPLPENSSQLVILADEIRLAE